MQKSSTDTMIDRILEDVAQDAIDQQSLRQEKIYGVQIGHVVALHQASEPVVDFPRCPKETGILAKTTIEISEKNLGHEAVLMFEEGNPQRPVLIGLVQQSKKNPISESHAISDGSHTVNAELDGERLIFSAKKEIVLKCGKASITLTKAGKIILRGAYLLSRSSGVNRIKGGSVQIN